MKTHLSVLIGIALCTLAAKKPPEPRGAPVEAISRGDADGAYDAVLDDARGMRVAYVTRDGEPPGEPELHYRQQSLPGIWVGDERVLVGSPDEVRLAPGAQPVIVYRMAGALRVAERGKDQRWTSRELVEAALRPAGFEVLGKADTRRIVVATTHAEGGTWIRRLALAAGVDHKPEQADLALPPNALPRVALAAAGDGEHLVYEATSEVLRAALGVIPHAPPEPTTTLVYTRLTRTVLPPFLLGRSDRTTSVALTTLKDEPVIAWLADNDGRTRLQLLRRRMGRFGVAEVLLDTDKTVSNLALASGGSVLIVAAIVDHRLVMRRLENQFWSDWTAPPGIDRATEYAPVAIVALVDDVGNARLVTRELTVGLLKRHRVVEWLAPGGTILTLTK